MSTIYYSKPIKKEPWISDWISEWKVEGNCLVIDDINEAAFCGGNIYKFMEYTSIYEQEILEGMLCYLFGEVPDDI